MQGSMMPCSESLGISPGAAHAESSKAAVHARTVPPVRQQTTIFAEHAGDHAVRPCCWL